MVGAIVYQLTRNVSPEDIKKAGWDAYFADLNENLAADAANEKNNHLEVDAMFSNRFS